ncbi:deoxyribose-phosphate aldolase [Clostridium sp. cel8]|jgi:deoxyribose-phosphate aldolase|uniref:deoxyribose-phosphate aldolase n=1 Tax=unclassified Clostridium TaxID=2614128 RepID=UPI0015F4935B|nr:deoxyribose-phosphate aldolase [Clostridium sp. cel8]MBA5851620.1 deoxyribose-phosphate aldolase [Clostridium sp. cel8]
MKLTKKEFLAHVDHSLLKPELTKQQVIEGLNFAKENSCASVCINPCNLDLAYEILHDTNVKIGTVIGFPSGAHTTFSKVAEAKDAYSRGAVELDMVINISALKSGDTEKVKNDIKSVVDATPAIVKVILENCFLTKEEIVLGSKLVEEAGAAYVKTSTGFAKSGATVEDVRLMRQSVSDKVKVKAAGGIHTFEECMALMEAGADRIGISRTKDIISEI